MQINANNPVSNQVQELESVQKLGQGKEEKEQAAGQQVAQAEDNPDYRISLSEMAKQNIAEKTAPPEMIEKEAQSDLTEQEAAELAQNTAARLSQTNMAIANQALQKAVNLFS